MSLIISIGILSYFKYANFFIESLNSLLNHAGIDKVEWTSVALPIGISFFTFQKITYGIDVYRGVHKPLKRVWDYLLYIIMFPQLVAGPIIRFNTIADQIEYRDENIDNIYLGLIRFIIGLAKKVLIANVLGAYASSAFGAIDTISSTEAWLGIICYTFQIYFDFAGYSDMAIGLGRIFGFKFPENFNNPYISGSITEFWRRWHITLGAWLKDYLYIPLGGNQVKTKKRLYLNLWVVFLISGLWHGASWNFVLWGAFHGFFLVIEKIFLLKLLKKAGKTIAIPITFLITMMGWVIFKIEDFSNIFLFYKKLFMFNFTPITFIDNSKIIITIIIASVFSFITLFHFGKKLEQIIFADSYSYPTKWIMFIISFLLLIICIGSLAVSNFNPFIYFRF
ncbi:MAG: MBOAT family protein [Prolixibacteraceae bacterium]|nr:MBOAT family protein [Prolixibacteraceae bacterium]